MLRDPEMAQYIQEMRSGRANAQELIQKSLDYSVRHPESTLALTSELLQYASRKRQLEAQIQEVRHESRSNMLQAFAAGTILPYVAMAVFYAYTSIRMKAAARALAKSRAPARPEEIVHSPSLPETTVDAEEIRSGPTPRKSGSFPAQRTKAFIQPEQKRGFHNPEPKKVFLNGSDSPLNREERRSNRPPPAETNPGVFSKETNDAFQAAGIRPETALKAFIRGFRILNTSHIIIGERRGETAQVRKRLKGIMKDDGEIGIFLSFLAKEGVIVHSNGTDCVSLNPEPETETGKRIIAEITAKQAMMAGKARNGREACARGS